MKVITQASEKRINDMVKENHKYGEALLDLLNDMKAREGWLGGTIKEMKDSGIELENETEIKTLGFDAPLYNALAIMYPQYINSTFCLDLSYVSVYDFNALVKAVSGMERNGWAAC